MWGDATIQAARTRAKLALDFLDPARTAHVDAPLSEVADESEGALASKYEEDMVHDLRAGRFEEV